jgi:beta-glucan synthesis-associated protein KRE6
MKPSSNQQINFYNETLARTRGGNLELLFSNEPKTFPTDPGKTATAPIQSAMVQTWNKFCFTEGIIEMRAQMPGKWNQAGLWPGFWMMGNL